MSNRRERFQNARSFVNYYGRGQVNKLSNNDVVIVEPKAYSINEVQELKNLNTLVLAYVAIMELGPFHDFYQMVKEEDFLRNIQGERYYKKEFDTYVMDLKSKRWKGLLYHHIGSLILRKGFDGIFMDTIGNVEDLGIPPMESKHLLNHAVEITRNLREFFPNHVIVQNNGLERLCIETGPYLDGICWENPLFSHSESLDWCEAVMERMIHLKETYGVRALFLHEANEVKLRPSAGIMAQSIADRYGFLYYEAPDYYLSLP